MRLTAASATPGCFCSVRCTRDWHAAQVIPLTGMRIVSVPSPLVARVSRTPGFALVLMVGPSVLRDDGAAEHAHAAHELVAARLRRRDLDGGLLPRREEATDSEVGEDDFLQAAGRVLPVEDEAHGRACLHPHLRRAVAALDGDGDLCGRRTGRRAGRR